MAAIRPDTGIVDRIHPIYMEVVERGAGTRQQHPPIAVAKTLIDEQGVEHIVPAETELSALFGESGAPFAHTDCTRLHVDAIISTLANQ